MVKNEGPMGDAGTTKQGSGKSSAENVNPVTGPLKSLGSKG